MNLILNAVEATGERPGRGARDHLHPRDSRPVTACSTSAPTRPPPGVYVAVDVMDDGCGMSELVKAQIFDPFFTTKFTGRGLGLSAALGIVRGHKGAIGVESAEGSGSRFTVLLPARRRCRTLRRTPARETAPMPSAHTSAGTILIIDDEDVVRRAARATLEHYRVHRVRSVRRPRRHRPVQPPARPHFAAFCWTSRCRAWMATTSGDSSAASGPT